MLTIDDDQIVRTIDANNPDGGSRRPTDADYDAFRAWVIDRYGQKWWDRYTVRDEDTGLTWVQERTRREV